MPEAKADFLQLKEGKRNPYILPLLKKDMVWSTPWLKLEGLAVWVWLLWMRWVTTFVTSQHFYYANIYYYVDPLSTSMRINNMLIHKQCRWKHFMPGNLKFTFVSSIYWIVNICVCIHIFNFITVLMNYRCVKVLPPNLIKIPVK